jgi:DNA-directed RNA polymerase specialized sigma24 family protein
MEKRPGWCISALDGHQSTFLIFSPFSSFFFLENFIRLFAGLAGSEIDDFKKMPYLWRIHIRRALDRYSQAKTKMSRMRQHEKLEKRNIPCSYWGEAALLLQRLWFAFFRAVNSTLKNFSFFFLLIDFWRLFSLE